MALDIYCGSLGRYYAHNWCNIEEQKTKGKEPGIEGERMTELCNLPISAEETGEVVLQWKEYITGQIQAHHNCPVDWAEDLNGDYATDRLSWENFGALIIWALHVEMGRKAPLHRLNEDWDWTKEPVYRKYVDEKDYKPHYSAIITGPQLSLPVDVPFTFTAQCPSGKVIPMASSLRQHEQLLELNEASWKATPEEILSWKETYKDASILEERAKQAYSVYYALSNFCMEHNVPMMLVF